MALRIRGVLYRFAWRTSLFAAVGMLFLSLSPTAMVGATSGTSYAAQSFTEGWISYNHEPSGGSGVESFGGREEVFRIGVDSTNMALDPTDRIEGVQHTLASSDTIKATLYLENAWQTQLKDVRIGIGVVGKDTSDVVSANIAIEFIRTASFSGWRIGNDTAGWTYIGNGYMLDAWNEIEFALNKSNNRVDIYINGNIVTQNNPSQASYLSDVMLTNYNFGHLGNDYEAHWSTLEVGQYDEVAPTIAFLTPAVSGEVLGGSRYVSVMASDETMLRQIAATIYNADNEVVRENAPYIAGTDCRLDVSLAGLPDGAYRIEAGAMDNASNDSDLIARSFVVDSSAPQVAITSPTSGMVKGNVTIEGSVTDTHPDHYYFAVKNSNGEVVAGPQTVNGSTVSDWQWDTTTQSDGTYVIVLAAEDKAGNQNEISKEVVVDNTAPVVTLDAFESSPITGRQLVFGGDVNDPGAYILLRIDGVDYPVIEKWGGRWSHTFVNGLSAGDHSVAVIAVDEQGNASSTANSPLSARDIMVLTSVFAGRGSGSDPLEVKPLIDTARLFQTATVPQGVAKPPLETGGGADILKQFGEATPIATTESPSVALEPTENGWKILGTLWYWWVFCVALVAVGGWYVITRWVRRPKAETLTD